MEGRNIWKKGQGSKVEAPGESGCIDFLSSDCGFYQDDSLEKGYISFSNPQQEHQIQSFSVYGRLDNLTFNGPSLLMEGRLEEIAKLGVQDVVESKKEERCPLSLSAIRLLNSHGSGFKRLNGERIH
ncbi:putative GRAS family transcription factor [Tripterygium wilfordii]|uniref:Putative GRAS family transcription factor n=1 Tax=Tripterygium wilfordii TaxID=458696 RepID=A0A7J7CSI6_TRIWF|nr:putative GRAS family transcription factor [Tripterygium wilfordii]